MKPRIPVAARFWLGVALPTLIFVFFILFIVFAARVGQGFAPVVVLLLSAYALPVILLVNCWVLFVDWSSRKLLIAAGLAVPLCVGVAMAILIQSK
jgi:hypothetical protein